MSFSRLKEAIIPSSCKKKKERKEKFIENLKGPQVTVSVAPTVRDGAALTVVNTATAHMVSCCKNGNKWMVWGTIEFSDKSDIAHFTDKQFEEFLSEQRYEAEEKNGTLRISDEYGCLTWDIK